jgi:uncharacterized protein YjiS (DUF1127 family)
VPVASSVSVLRSGISCCRCARCRPNQCKLGGRGSDGVRTATRSVLFTVRSPLIGLFLCIGRATAALGRGTWQIIAARQNLARLVDLDDRMLADIGLTRSDLHTAQSACLWQDPTSLLERRVNRRRATFELLTQTPLSTVSDTDPTAHCAAPLRQFQELPTTRLVGVSQSATAPTTGPQYPWKQP